MKATEQDIDKLFSGLRITSVSDCWVWTLGRSTRGYGAIDLRGRQYRTHRLMYAVVKDYDIDFDPRVEVRHRCNNTKCANPFHLSEGSRKDNAQDYQRYLAENVKCPLGHAREIYRGRIKCLVCASNVNKAQSTRYRWDSSLREFVLK